MPVAEGSCVSEGRAVWYIRATVGDEDRVTSVADEGVSSAANFDSAIGLLTVVSSALGLRDMPSCESLTVAGVLSTVVDAVAVATCNWLTSMYVGGAADSGFVTEEFTLLDGEVPVEGVAVKRLLSSMAAGAPHAHSAAMKGANIAPHRKGPKAEH